MFESNGGYALDLARIPLTILVCFDISEYKRPNWTDVYFLSKAILKTMCILYYIWSTAKYNYGIVRDIDKIMLYPSINVNAVWSC